MKKPADRKSKAKPDKKKKTRAGPGAKPGLIPERRYRVERAVRRYGDALEQGRFGTRADGDKARQVEEYQKGLLEQGELMARVEGLLSARGVARLWHNAYCNYARKLSGLARKHTGEVLCEKAQLALEHSVAQGLDRDALVEVREEVFNIGEPGSSSPLP